MLYLMIFKEFLKSKKKFYELLKCYFNIFHFSFHIAFETPELVVVGNQSDGKSSFIEGLLGFQFNIVASSILFLFVYFQLLYLYV